MKYSILIFVIFLFLSCTHNDSNKSYLTGNSVKFWDVIDSMQSTRYCYSFSTDGTCKYYYYKGNSCERNIMYDDDVSYENTWEFKKDATLRFRSFDRKIIILNADTLLLMNNDKQMLLVKSQCQNK